ncbi:low molecular weight protein tyrosine phosphatase family protein [Burkholderia ubonensis]|uniref:low molecular weight protein tyrosine phosphatase family protein n=1 Tax=Burkholderia ubonensis TaxID=101571 RepID=UPI000755D238|nr:low molecular weight protein tyrosine phosphatase family protein [Burkholderia ubonensis]KVW31895.1 phosphotyrosine protein phosphatase [Burkholderia ubonensis]KWC56667.1 phosphotyrosine protein phosphatase [Burkholderia ubonensis]
MTRALFVCSRNRLRSPTAEEWFVGWPGIETDSAGVAPDADSVVSREQIAWADIIFVMERAHKAKLSKQFGADLRNKKIVCLDIPDKYAFMQPELIALLERRAGKFLRS